MAIRTALGSTAVEFDTLEDFEQIEKWNKSSDRASRRASSNGAGTATIDPPSAPRKGKGGKKRGSKRPGLKLYHKRLQSLTDKIVKEKGFDQKMAKEQARAQMRKEKEAKAKSGRGRRRSAK